MDATTRILVVEDDRDVLGFVADALVLGGWEPMTARNGVDALALAAGRQPALILLDLQMPVMDGWEFLKAYRRSPGPHAPVVIMAGGGGLSGRATTAGADGYIMKPFGLDELLAVVARHARVSAAA